jgi:glycosyltransferase involved in cell wall biosynthesis
MSKNKIHVLQIITPVGFYGAERWILALVNNSDPEFVRHDLAVTQESDSQDLEITEHYPEGEGQTFRVKMSGRFDLKVINALSEIVRQRQIEVIHTHGYKSDILGFIVAKKNGIKCISTPHGFGQPETLKLKLFIKLGLVALRFMDHVLPLSAQLHQEILRLGIPESKVQTIQNAVDLVEVDSVRQENMREDVGDRTKKIGYIGRFDENKNVIDIIKIFHRIWQLGPEVELILVGDGDTREELERYTANLESRDVIHFLGFRHDRLNWLKDFDIFIMTSLNEGIPRCVMEAMGMGVPVVAYDIPGVAQLISHQTTGFLAEVGDIDGMVNNCRQLLAESELATRIAQQAREFVDHQFSGKRMAREYLGVYRDILGPG